MDTSKPINPKEHIWLISRPFFSWLSEIVFANWTSRVFLKPVRDAFGMEDMLAWELHKLLTLLKVAVANYTFFLIF